MRSAENICGDIREDAPAVHCNLFTGSSRRAITKRDEPLDDSFAFNLS
jgi:hypothetical protein